LNAPSFAAAATALLLPLLSPSLLLHPPVAVVAGFSSPLPLSTTTKKKLLAGKNDNRFSFFGRCGGRSDTGSRSGSSNRYLVVRSATTSSTTTSSSASTGKSQSSSVPELCDRIERAILNGEAPDPDLLKQLERLNAFEEPNRRREFFGEWHVWYTDCPPPSNGQLGPFRGTASQVIPSVYIAEDEDDGSSTTKPTTATTGNNSNNKRQKEYKNLLRVPPNDWLTATLDGVWEEWDGRTLPKDDGGDGDENNRNKNARAAVTAKKFSSSENDDDDDSYDWGAAHWKVTFLQLQIGLLGVPIFTKRFDKGTCRIWRTTYLDDDTRIVRAGKTGLRQDEVVFYTKRTPLP